MYDDFGRDKIYNVDSAAANTSSRAPHSTAPPGLARRASVSEELTGSMYDESGREIPINSARASAAKVPATPRLRPQAGPASPTMSDILELTESTPAGPAKTGQMRDTPALSQGASRWAIYASTGQHTPSPIVPRTGAASYMPIFSPIAEQPSPPLPGSGTALMMNGRGEYVYRVQIPSGSNDEIPYQAPSSPRGLNLGECFEPEIFSAAPRERVDIGATHMDMRHRYLV